VGSSQRNREREKTTPLDHRSEKGEIFPRGERRDLVARKTGVAVFVDAEGGKKKSWCQKAAKKRVHLRQLRKPEGEKEGPKTPPLEPPSSAPGKGRVVRKSRLLSGGGTLESGTKCPERFQEKSNESGHGFQKGKMLSEKIREEEVRSKIRKQM